jgi:hypothetical protein
MTCTFVANAYGFRKGSSQIIACESKMQKPNPPILTNTQMKNIIFKAMPTQLPEYSNRLTPGG